MALPARGFYREDRGNGAAEAFFLARDSERPGRVVVMQQTFHPAAPGDRRSESRKIELDVFLGSTGHAANALRELIGTLVADTDQDWPKL